MQWDTEAASLTAPAYSPPVHDEAPGKQTNINAYHSFLSIKKYWKFFQILPQAHWRAFLEKYKPKSKIS